MKSVLSVGLERSLQQGLSRRPFILNFFSIVCKWSILSGCATYTWIVAGFKLLGQRKVETLVKILRDLHPHTEELARLVMQPSRIF